MPQQYAGLLPEAVSKRVALMGDEGRAWLRELDGIVADLQKRWSCEVTQVLTGGSESLAAFVQHADGTRAVLKIGIPGSVDAEREAAAYALADGRGYASILQSDQTCNALLVEALNESLASRDLPVHQQIEYLTRALKKSWVPAGSYPALMRGTDKLEWLRDFIEQKWQELQKPTSADVLRRAFEFIDERTDQHQDALAVLVHGDAHAENLLRADEGRYKFVDPDGLCAEPACDLAVLMREWDEELLRDNKPVHALLERCAQLNKLTNVGMRDIWQWGFIERVSTGLHLLELGWPTEGRLMLDIAESTCHEELK